MINFTQHLATTPIVHEWWCVTVEHWPWALYSYGNKQVYIPIIHIKANRDPLCSVPTVTMRT